MYLELSWCLCEAGTCVEESELTGKACKQEF